MTVKLVDPPSGWMYGFPAVLEEDYPAQLRKAGYPEEDMELAMRHSRIIYIEEDDDR
jgi:hypothetical protein